MAIYSFHLTELNPFSTFKTLYSPPTPNNTPGLQHAECLAMMTLGAPILSIKRMQLQNLVMFAAWDSSDAIDHFLSSNQLGQKLSSGWHVRMNFTRCWGHVSEFGNLPEVAEELPPDAPVVSVTLARMKLLQVPRFIRWGKPVEKLVRDHPGTSISLAAMRFPRTVSTFSVWNKQSDMLDMVHGRSDVPEPKRHADAMIERVRKDFHSEFTTLRFKPLAEFGSWQGRTNLIPF